MSCVAGIPGTDTFYGWDWTADTRYIEGLGSNPPTGGTYTSLGYANTEQEASFTLPITAEGPGYWGIPGNNDIQRLDLRPVRYFLIRPRVFIAASLEVQRVIKLTIDIETTDDIFYDGWEPGLSNSQILEKWGLIEIQGGSGPSGLGKRAVLRCHVATYAVEVDPDLGPALSVIPIGFPFIVTCVFE